MLDAAGVPVRLSGGARCRRSTQRRYERLILPLLALVEPARALQALRARGPAAQRRAAAPRSARRSGAGRRACRGGPRARACGRSGGRCACAPRARARPSRAPSCRRSTGAERVQRVVAGEEDRLAVGHHRVVGAALVLEHLAAGARAEPDRALVAEVGVVDDVADHRRAARDPAVAAARPAHGAGARVERVEAAAVGAGVDERAPARHLRRPRARRRRSRRCSCSRRACRSPAENE